MKKLIKVLAVATLVASFGIWVYAYGFVERTEQDVFADAAVVVPRAEATCAAAVADVDAMPGALLAEDGQERAQQIRNSTDRFSAMIDDLSAIEPTTENDRAMWAGWLDNWQTILDDRYRYADAIAADPDAQYLQTDIGGVERLDRRVTRFANVNEMYSCVSPTDA